jgi:uncharacterized protein (TIGR01244 family)
MDIRTLTPAYHVSPQISVEDVATLKEAGFTRVICNRPDAEVPPSHQASAIGQAVRTAGLEFNVLEITREVLGPELAAAQAELVTATDKVLAYCASGTRSTMVWAIAQATETASQEILETAQSAGYDLAGMAPYLDGLRQS